MEREEKYLSCKGFDFRFDPTACERCGGKCCNGESGYIWVNSREIGEISAFLEMEATDFVGDCLRKVDYRYSIKELKTGGNYTCLFYDNDRNGCAIYPVRPAQCRSFPFWEYYRSNPEELARQCPGVLL